MCHAISDTSTTTSLSGTRNIRDFFNARDAAFDAQTTLAHISLASKWLNAVATPHLYHRPACSEWWPLARTLLARPDLALHVRYLYDYFQDDTFKEWVNDGDFPFPPEIARHFSTSRLARMALGEEVIPDYPPIREAWDFWMWESAESFDMLASLCPNVRHIPMGPIRSPHPFTYSDPRSLMRVELVEIGLSHCKENSVDVNMLAQIATVAPRITCILWESNPKPEALARPLDACPNLRLLVYESLVRRWHSTTSETSYELQETIARYAPNLTSLNIYRLGGMLAAQILRGRESPLSRLSRLKHLEMGLECLVPPRSGSRDPCMRRMLFVDVLPATIRSVRITWPLSKLNRELRPLFRSLIRLASLLPERFPRLQSVTNCGLSPDGVPVEEI
ncbi:hypothetical protein C7999DRAFT_34366, partial [Corynascus novoguineensis]